MKAKKVLALGIGVGLIISMCGCRYDYTYDFSSDTRAKLTTAVYYTEEEAKEMSSDLSKYEKVTLEDGKTYYMDSKVEDKSYEDLNNGLDIGVMKPNLVYVPCDKIDDEASTDSETSLPDINSAMKINMEFVLGEDVTETNGELREDKRTVYYDYSGKNKDGYLFVYTESGKQEIESDATAPVINGLKKNKYVNSDGLMKLRISDNLALKSVTCNGSEMKAVAATSNGKTVNYWRLKDKTKYIQGKNKIVAIDLNGNKTTYTFKYDDEPPVVKKLKNYSAKKRGKNFSFYVKDSKSGIKKVTYSKNYYPEKKVAKKSIKKVTKGKYKGYYKVTVKFKNPTYLRFFVYDKAGNKAEIYGVNVY